MLEDCVKGVIMPFEYLDDIATADAAFRAWGVSKEEMFTAAAEATLGVMVGDLSSIEERQKRQVELRAQSLEMLLFGFLQELIFYKDAERLLLRVTRLEIGQREGEFMLTGQLAGEEIDTARHELMVDVKAVTLHRFEAVKLEEIWQSRVILDI